MSRDLDEDMVRAKGLTTRRQLTALGHSRRSLLQAAAAGRLTVPRRGWIADTSAPPDALLAVMLGGQLGGASALESFGIWNDGGELVISCAPTASRLPSLGPNQRRLWIRRAFVEPSQLPWRVSVRDALLQHAMVSDRSSLIASIDSALYTRMLRPTQLADLVDALPARLKSVAREIDARSMSGTETKMRLACVAAGLRVDIQVTIPGVGTVDLLIDEWLIVEVDSRKHHDEPIQQHKDRVRDGNSVLGRFGHVRVDYLLVQHELSWCMDVIFARLAEGRP
jgi:very-short-patch-repair endonuclease